MDADAQAEDFARFYRRHLRRVEGYLRGRARSAEASKDLVAETFATALVHRRSFRGSSLPEETAWILAIARSQLSHHWRRGSIEASAVARLEASSPRDEEPPSSRVEQLCDVHRVRPRLLAALSELPPEQQRTVALRVVHDLDYAAIADETGVSEQVARARASRGLRALGRRLTAAAC